ncbi:hypothetical protein AAC387_Pa06g0492 [Persea americana]
MRSQSLHLFFDYLDCISNLRFQDVIVAADVLVIVAVAVGGGGGGGGGVCTSGVVIATGCEVFEVRSGSCRDTVEIELSRGDADMEEGNREQSGRTPDKQKHKEENSRWIGERSS